MRCAFRASCGCARTRMLKILIRSRPCANSPVKDSSLWWERRRRPLSAKCESFGLGTFCRERAITYHHLSIFPRKERAAHAVRTGRPRSQQEVEFMNLKNIVAIVFAIGAITGAQAQRPKRPPG